MMIKPNVEVYAICYNEELMLPYFLRHYSKFCSKITIYDNMSTDKSVDIMKMFGVTIIPYDTNCQIRDDVYLQIKNTCWKRSDADWVIVCDIDEFIHCDDILNTLNNVKGNIIEPIGYQMVSENIPRLNGMIYDELKSGFVDNSYSKRCIFKPKQIKEIDFMAGCHQQKHPVANTGYTIKVAPVNNMKQLHYKFINVDWLIERYRIYSKRMSEINKINGWGANYLDSINKIKKDFYENLKKSSPIFK